MHCRIHTVPVLCSVSNSIFLLSTPLLFSFNAPAPPSIYTLSLHDALPISGAASGTQGIGLGERVLNDPLVDQDAFAKIDRKSTRLNSSHITISYAVFCLKKKKKKKSKLNNITLNSQQHNEHPLNLFTCTSH